MKLSKRMQEAIKLLEQEEFYLFELSTWSMWKAYNLPDKTIRTDTMKALENRGIVKITQDISGRSSKVAEIKSKH